MKNDLIQGDCIEKMKELEENSVDSIVTDPPYGIGFMGKAWDTFEPGYKGEEILKAKTKRGKRSDGSEVVGGINSPAAYAGVYDRSNKAIRDYQNWCYEWAKECLRVLKPGGHLLASNSSRMYHRMASGIEDAGFEIRDQIMWLYGSGFPKSHNIGKAVDKLQGNERIPYERPDFVAKSNKTEQRDSQVPCGEKGKYTKGTSEWEGWGTALKPAHEPIVVARKPLSEKTVAKNVLKWGTGGINIDGCRVGTEEMKARPSGKTSRAYQSEETTTAGGMGEDKQGRFPANIILDEEAGKMLDEQSGVSKGGKTYNYKDKQYKVEGFIKDNKPNSPSNRGDKGGASRFFYCAKASKSERNAGCEELSNEKFTAGNYSQSPVCKDCDKTLNGTNNHDKCSGEVYYRKMESKKTQNNHPTVKPVKLMEYLVRLVTPKGGTVLDPFMGSGTTGIACKKEEFNFIGMEKEEEYCKIAETRIKAIRINNKLL